MLLVTSVAPVEIKIESIYPPEGKNVYFRTCIEPPVGLASYPNANIEDGP